MAQTQILDKTVAQRKMERIALEIAEEFYGETGELIIVGIEGSGMAIARHLTNLINIHLSLPVKLVSCFMNKKKPDSITYDQTVDFTDRTVLLVDDVSNSGRTMLYALKPLLEFLPKKIQTVALVERMHKNFPVKVDFIGLSVATTLQDHIVVEVNNGVVEGAYII